MPKNSWEPKRNSRYFAFLAIVGVCVSLTAVGGVDVRLSSAQAATSTRLWTETDRVALSSDLALAAFTAGSSTVVVSEDSVEATHVAGVVGARADAAVLVSSSGDSAKDVLSDLQALKATEVILVASTPGNFTTAFRSDLVDASINVDATVESTDSFGLWVQAAEVSGLAAEYVIARSDDEQAVAIATASAMTRGVPLVLWGADTPAAELEAFFSSIASAKVTAIGDPSVNPTDSMREEQISSLRVFDTSDAQKAFTWVASDAQAAGRLINKVYAAPVDSLDALALAGGIARRGAGILAPTGKAATLTSDSRASEYLLNWKSRVASVALVGFGMTEASVNQLTQPASVSDAPAPAFHVTNLQKDASGYTLSVTPVTGASVYNAYDFDGSVLASSSASDIALPSALTAALVTAEDSSGEFARMDVRANEYERDDQRPSVIVGSVSSGASNLQILGNIKTPRLITRITHEPYDESVAPTKELPVAITCESSFSETGLDATKEYEYSVTDLTNVDATTCSAPSPETQAVAGSFYNMQISLPATVDPSVSTEQLLSVDASQMKVYSKRPVRTMADRFIAENAAKQLRVDSTAAAPQEVGDDYSPLLFRYMAYIPEKKAPLPAPSGDPSHPILVFHGDEHSSDPNGSYRYRQDLTFYFGRNHSIAYSESMGESVRYKCTRNLVECIETGRKTASLDQLNFQGIDSENDAGTARVQASTSLPLIPIAPPIDSDIVVKLSPGKSVIFGYHDLMPQHEAYVGVPNSEWFRVYKSPYNSFAQLPCLYSSPSKIISGCGAAVNVSL